jgi:hypothetical protein
MFLTQHLDDFDHCSLPPAIEATQARPRVTGIELDQCIDPFGFSGKRHLGCRTNSKVKTRLAQRASGAIPPW